MQLCIFVLSKPLKIENALFPQSAKVFGKLPSASPPPAAFIKFASPCVHAPALEVYRRKVIVRSKSFIFNF